MTCKHELRVDKTQYKNHIIYRVTCTKCGRRTVWVESPELAKEFFCANDDYALLARTMQPKYCPYCGQKLWWKR